MPHSKVKQKQASGKCRVEWIKKKRSSGYGMGYRKAAGPNRKRWTSGLSAYTLPGFASRMYRHPSHGWDQFPEPFTSDRKPDSLSVGQHRYWYRDIAVKTKNRFLRVLPSKILADLHSFLHRHNGVAVSSSCCTYFTRICCSVYIAFPWLWLSLSRTDGNIRPLLVGR